MKFYLGGHAFCRLALPQLGCTTSAEKVLDYLRRGVGLQENGDLEGAIAEYRAALRLEPGYAPPHTNLGAALADKGDLEGAIAEFRTALRLRARLRAPPYQPRGRAVGQGGHGGRDRRIPHRPSASTPNTRLPIPTSGPRFVTRGDSDGAIAEFRTALRLHPNDVLAHFNLGTCLQAKEDIDGAIVEYRTALRLDPTYALAHTNLGKALQAKGDLALAGKEFEEALQLISQTSQNRARIKTIIPSANNSPSLQRRTYSVHFAGDGDE